MRLITTSPATTSSGFKVSKPFLPEQSIISSSLELLDSASSLELDNSLELLDSASSLELSSTLELLDSILSLELAVSLDQLDSDFSSLVEDLLEMLFSGLSIYRPVLLWRFLNRLVNRPRTLQHTRSRCL